MNRFKMTRREPGPQIGEVWRPASLSRTFCYNSHELYVILEFVPDRYVRLLNPEGEVLLTSMNNLMANYAKDDLK